jgi:hypothetical protein
VTQPPGVSRRLSLLCPAQRGRAGRRSPSWHRLPFPQHAAPARVAAPAGSQPPSHKCI